MFEPENELGVIVLFAQQCEEAGFEIVSIQQEYPDAIVHRNGAIYRAEFEYCASNFNQHGHDPREADLIICWKYDTDSVLPVLALSESGWQEKEIVLPTQAEREAAYWKRRALQAESSTKQIKYELDAYKKAEKETGGLIDANVLFMSKLGKEIETLQACLENPGMTQEQVAKVVGVSRRTVSNHLARLEQAGAIRRNGNGIELQVDIARPQQSAQPAPQEEET